MVSACNGKCTNEIQEELSTMINDDIEKDHTSTSRRGLLDEDNNGNIILHIVTPSSKFRKIAEEKNEVTFAVPSSDQSYPHVPSAKKINWSSLWALGKEWIRDPMNMALAVWITCVAISGAILFFVMTGILNGAIPNKSDRDTWFEVNNQILNALFTLMCLYQHPKRFHHLVLLCRWNPKDVLRLRKIYSKNGTYKPNEWMHMMVVVLLLHVNCFAQYALCGLNLGYPRSKRPAIGVGLCISVAIGAPAIASVYNILSPLGKEYETTVDQESQDQIASSNHFQMKSLEKKYSFMSRDDQRFAQSSPQWVGGLFDFWDDVSLAYLSVFCSCCVFGWNMERLGFGNMYVHIVTFLLFCVAPFFIFNLAAVNMESDAIRGALGIAGFALCIFGLLYGGFWRIQMRKRFNLPANTFCCGRAAVTDGFQWLCCCSCSLAQEVRTADFYDIEEDKLYIKRTGRDAQPVLSPLRREDGNALEERLPAVDEENDAMKPPVLSEIGREDSMARLV